MTKNHFWQAGRYGFQKSIRCIPTLVAGILLVCLAIVCIPLAAQQTAPQSNSKPIIRLGDGARGLSDAELLKLERLLPQGSKPWLLSGDVGAMKIPTIEVYLQPETETIQLRRGVIVTLRRPPPTANSQEWVVLGIETRYAQIAMNGRSYDDIRGDQDLNRPFRIEGSWDDADLITLATFVRSMYSNLPLRGLRLQPDGQISAAVRESASTSVVLYVRKQGQNWVVISTVVASS